MGAGHEIFPLPFWEDCAFGTGCRETEGMTRGPSPYKGKLGPTPGVVAASWLLRLSIAAVPLAFLSPEALHRSTDNLHGTDQRGPMSGSIDYPFGESELLDIPRIVLSSFCWWLFVLMFLFLIFAFACVLARGVLGERLLGSKEHLCSKEPLSARCSWNSRRLFHP